MNADEIDVAMSRRPDGETESYDRLLHALRNVREAAQSNSERSAMIAASAAEIERRLLRGESMSDALLSDVSPRIVELLSENVASLSDSGAAFRTTEALVLHEGGMTMVEIAELFGVTRQRVSALLRHARSS